MENSMVTRFVQYNISFKKLKELLECGKAEQSICNMALVGIAKDLGIMNPVLL